MSHPSSLSASSLRVPKHFDGKRYFNPGAPPARGLLGVLRWKFTSRPEASPKFFDDVTPVVPPARVDGPELRITLINHTTVLLQQDGLNLLTDPIWSDHAGPFSRIGPRRRRLPGVKLTDLPPIDVVLLSHNHFDHLDLPTLRWLARERRPSFIVPLGVKKLLDRHRLGSVVELDWGQTHSWNEVAVHAVPAVHFSARGPFDRNETLWCGYVLESTRSIYFAGDTAFGDHFAAIRDAFGPPDVALLPIGAYAPRWMMSPVHMDPEEAVRAHAILQPKVAIATHHGTFQLADDAVDTPPRELLKHAQPGTFVVLKNGEHLEIR